MENSTLAGAIRRAREAAGLSQEKLAEQVEVSRQAVSKWEMGLAVPTQDNLGRLEQALGLADGALREVCDTPGAPQADKTILPLKRIAVLAGVGLIIGLCGFFAGRATAPVLPTEEQPTASAPVEEGPETKIIWRRTASHRENPNPYDSEERSTYDEMGRLLKREILGGPADPTVRASEFVYDGNGNQVEQRSYVDGALVGRQEYKYDDKGNLTLSRSVLPDGTVEEWFEMVYDERGNQISHQQYSGEGKLLHSGRYTYTYYEDGSYEKDYLTPSSLGSDNLPWHVIEYYDPYGNLVKQTESDMNGSELRVWTFEYQSFEVPVDFDPQF